MVIEVKEAVQIAKDNLELVFESENPRAVRLEEVILDDNSNWIITLSYVASSTLLEEATPLSILGSALNNKRVFKIVKISKKDGSIKSIKMREND